MGYTLKKSASNHVTQNNITHFYFAELNIFIKLIFNYKLIIIKSIIKFIFYKNAFYNKDFL